MKFSAKKGEKEDLKKKLSSSLQFVMKFLPTIRNRAKQNKLNLDRQNWTKTLQLSEFEFCFQSFVIFFPNIQANMNIRITLKPFGYWWIYISKSIDMRDVCNYFLDFGRHHASLHSFLIAFARSYLTSRNWRASYFFLTTLVFSLRKFDD